MTLYGIRYGGPHLSSFDALGVDPAEARLHIAFGGSVLAVAVK